MTKRFPRSGHASISETRMPVTFVACCLSSRPRGRTGCLRTRRRAAESRQPAVLPRVERGSYRCDRIYDSRNQPVTRQAWVSCAAAPVRPSSAALRTLCGQCRDSDRACGFRNRRAFQFDPTGRVSTAILFIPSEEGVEPFRARDAAARSLRWPPNDRHEAWDPDNTARVSALLSRQSPFRGLRF
jgi:hypothetical protein